MSAGSSGFSISKPYGGSGMDLNSAGRILDPAGIFGGGGMNKTAAEAFFDPAGIDSNGGLNLFGKAGQNNQSNVPQTPDALGNLGAASMQPTYYDPNSFQPRQLTGGMFNQMAQQGAGPQYVPQIMHPQASNQTGGQNGVPGNSYAPPPVMPMTPLGQQVRANINGTEPMPQFGPGMMRGIKAQFGGFPVAHSTMPYSPYNGPIY
jgi:hypothetical protein